MRFQNASSLGLSQTAARPGRRVGRLTLSATVLALTAGIALAISPLSASADALGGKADGFLSHSALHQEQRGWTPVIVKLNGPLTSGQEAQLKGLGADIYRHLPIIGSVALKVPTRHLGSLAALAFVRHLSADVAVKKTDEFTVGHTGADVAFQQYNLTGSGIGVAVVDSGVHACPDLCTTGLLGTSLLSKTRILKSVNFFPGTTSVDDGCGHGSHVAGIIAGNATASQGLGTWRSFYGIARKANVISVRVLGNQGEGTVSSVLSGLQWVLDNKSKYNIRVLNLSLGHPVGESYTTDPLCQAVEQVWKAGIVVVCAAGNNGRLQNSPDPSLDNEGYGAAYGSINSPGNDPYVITVGAMKTNGGPRVTDQIATYSGRGPSRIDYVLKPDIVAPGNRIISLQADGAYLDQNFRDTNQVPLEYYRLSLFGGDSSRYLRLSGTSMAAPVVSGAALLMLEKSPLLTPDTVKARLMLSADKWVDLQGDANPCTYGAGYLNIPAALKCTAVATQSAMSPTLSQDDQGNVYINMDRALWGTRAIWGTGIYDLRAIWGTNALWGVSFNILDASRAIWGTTVWNDRAVWGVSFSGVDLSATAIQGE